LVPNDPSSCLISLQPQNIEETKSHLATYHDDLDSLIKDNLSVDGPNFEQKQYISYQHANYNWLVVRSHANILVLYLHVKAKSMDKKQIAKQLKIEEFDSNDSLSEKLNLPSSVDVVSRNELTDRIILRIKDDFDLNKPEFIGFLKDAFKNAAKG
jgi:hypothetical protein